MQNVLMVVIGAVFGATLRYALTDPLRQLWPQYPVGTILANCIGCFGAGLIFTGMPELNPSARAAVFIGFFGSLTTLSSLHIETLRSISEGRFTWALIHWMIGSIVGLALCCGGMQAGLRLARFL